MGTACCCSCPTRMESSETCCTARFRAGYQAAVFDTYQPNLAATAAREQAEAERQNHARWSEQ